MVLICILYCLFRHLHLSVGYLTFSVRQCGEKNSWTAKVWVGISQSKQPQTRAVLCLQTTQPQHRATCTPGFPFVFKRTDFSPPTRASLKLYLPWTQFTDHIFTDRPIVQSENRSITNEGTGVAFNLPFMKPIEFALQFCNSKRHPTTSQIDQIAFPQCKWKVIMV